jgi:PhnB protein
MAERNQIERLDEAVDAILAGRAPSVVDADLAMLLVGAADLRGMPDPAFRTRLRAELFGKEEKRVATQNVVPYFVVDGADDFIAFLQSAFGGELTGRFLRPDGSVMHAEVRIDDSTLELGNASERYAPLHLAAHVYVPNVDAVYERAVAAGGTSLYVPMDQPYGDREAGVKDRWGNHWYIATHQATGSRPAGLRTVTPFLHPRGTARLLDFLKRAFGAEEREPVETAPDGMIHHAVLWLGESAIEFGEAHGEWQPMPANMHVFVDDVDAIYERAVAAGAKSVAAPADQPYGERSAHVEDEWGNAWFLAKKL